MQVETKPDQSRESGMPCFCSLRSLNALDGRILALEPRLHERRVAEDKNRRGSDEPEEDGHGGREEQDREANDKERNVHCLLGDDLVADLDRLGREAVDGGEAAREEADGDQEERVRETGVRVRCGGEAHRA